MKYARGTVGFMQWLQVKFPHIYKEVKSQTGVSNLNGLGYVDPMTGAEITDTASNAQPMPSSLASNITTIAQTLAQAYLTKQQIDAQNAILQTNLKRAQMGLAPLDIDPTRYGLAPTASIGLSQDTKTFLTWAGAGLLGFLVLKHMMPRR